MGSDPNAEARTTMLGSDPTAHGFKAGGLIFCEVENAQVEAVTRKRDRQSRRIETEKTGSKRFSSARSSEQAVAPS